ncbi:perforin-like protein plp1 [Cystoisospora suis]|uniref:Perforin-like protein plp1 n=1 Tax=Cystoisospora suis TaxID=483139 RepID=A0A2C6KJP6_9APIC|nr:perforin-like protein plp1 [Cystoisospora suis]
MGKISPLDMADERRRRTADKTKEAVGKAREFQDFGKRGDRLGSTDWMKGDLQAPDVQWESREKKNIRTDADIYTAAHDTIPALDFLGTGYDALKGNPIGDPETSVDPGYRKPVVRFGWSHDAYGVTNDLSLLQPRGGYVRPFVSCRQSQTAEEVSSMSDYEKQLDVDASVGGGNMFVSFSASTSFRDMAKTFAQSDMKSFFIKTYCFRYEAGLANSPSINWNVTYGLEQSLRDLPTHFDGLMSTSTCQAFVYRSDPQSPECEETGVAKWMNLFNQYGTHVVTNVKLGGKIVHQVFVSKKAVDQLKDKGLSVSAQLSAGVIGFSASAGASTTDKTSERRADESLDKKVVTYVVGGRPPKDPTDPSSIVLWSKTVEDYPMPVQFELQPIRNFLPEQFRKAYDLAAAYYGLVHGMSQSELDQLANKEVVTLSKRLSEGHSLVWGGPPPGRVMCPGDEVIIAGFSLSFNFLDSDTDPNDYHLTICTPGLKLCEGKVASGKSHDDTRIWAVCGKSSMLGLRQFVIESLVGRKEQDKVLELHCPNGMALAWGMKLGIGYGPGGSIYSYVGHCISGKQTCRMRPRPQASRKYTRRFMYGACIEESYPGLRELSGISSVGDVGYVETKTDDDGSVILNCGTDRHILLGWALEAHTRMQATRTHYQNCEGGKQICIMKGSGLDQAPLVGGERKFRDTHALMAWGICVRDTPENPDPAPKAEPIGGPKHPELYIP